MKISASIYSSKDKPLPEIITELDHHEVDYFHVDCNDNEGVFNDIAYINGHSSTPVDLHIISGTPEKYFTFISKCKIKQVSFQYENFKHKINFPSSLNAEIGLAITSATPINAFEEYKDQCSFVLLMTTTPGQSGGQFDKNTFKRIRAFQKRYPGITIQVDGGVNAEVSFILRNLGVDSAVVGSYLFSKSYIGAALLNLKKEVVGSHYLLKDFMLTNEELPVLHEDNITFENTLQKIEDYKMAFTLIVDEQEKLKGLISNADVRRGLLKNINNLQNINVADIINRTPLSMNENKSIHDLLLFIKQANFPLQYLPVVNDENQLTGSILFTNLIKGEL
jgi:ribulose-phosphate 3-epimerase